MNRTDFPILREQVYGCPLVYLDNAATAQKPQAVLDALLDGYTHWNANIHRGVHHLSQVATKHHEDARQHVADFLHAKSAKEIVFTKGTTVSARRWYTRAMRLLSVKWNIILISYRGKCSVNAKKPYCG